MFKPLADETAAAIAAKGYTFVNVNFQISNIDEFPFISICYKDAADQRKSKYFSSSLFTSDNYRGVIFAWLDTLPPKDKVLRADLAAAMAKLLDTARSAGIEETYTAPMEALVKRLSENILTASAGADDDIPF